MSEKPLSPLGARGGKFLHSRPALRSSEVENPAIFPFDFAQGHLQSEPFGFDLPASQA